MSKPCGTSGYSDFTGIDNGWNERFHKNIEKQYIYPKGFHIMYFSKVNEISVNCESGNEFNPNINLSNNKSKFIGFLFFAIAVLFFILGLNYNYKCCSTSFSGLLLILTFVFLLTGVYFCAINEVQIKIHFKIYEKGLDIRVQKKSFFIEKENISSIGVKNIDGSYQIYLTCCKPVNLQNKKEKQVFNLFDKYVFKEETAEFIVQKIRNIWELDSDLGLVEIK